MPLLDLAIIGGYFLAMIGVGLFFMRGQADIDDYFVGDRSMGPGHIGLSVVATDVGGGFSIGLGGLGFTMGLSGSWLLFTGLIGAWMTAVLLIPKVKTLGDARGWLTFPDFLEHRFGGRTRALAAVVSAVGYGAFVGGQILAGATLSEVAFDVDKTTAVVVMAAVVVLYTTFGGLKAVVYTDTIQWIVLFGGLLLVGVPMAWAEVGGLEGIRAAVPEGHLSLTNVAPMQFLTWMVTIIPIWFVGNTLYQRIYASRDVKGAKRAWYLAGLLEWPLMAFLGVALGLCARVLFPEAEPEAGLPMVIRHVLPVGVTGIILAVYFSAIMSTADSCLLASVGNFITDIYQRYINPQAEARKILRLSRVVTLAVGAGSVAVALALPRVLDAILLAYAFMVSGLFVPTLAGLVWKRTTPAAAFWSMVTGGSAAVGLNVLAQWGPDLVARLEATGSAPALRSALAGIIGIEPVLIALPLSAVVLVGLTLLSPPRAGEGGAAAPSRKKGTPHARPAEAEEDDLRAADPDGEGDADRRPA